MCCNMLQCVAVCVQSPLTSLDLCSNIYICCTGWQCVVVMCCDVLKCVLVCIYLLVPHVSHVSRCTWKFRHCCSVLQRGALPRKYLRSFPLSVSHTCTLTHTRVCMCVCFEADIEVAANACIYICCINLRMNWSRNWEGRAMQLYIHTYTVHFHNTVTI